MQTTATARPRPVTLTRNAVTLYDIEAQRAWSTMSHQDAERDLAACSRLGDTLQDYDTVDRAGRPLRVVLQICAPDEGRHDLGGVYEFTR
ncbi:hypothetical protein [Streptomyces violaceusniger]|uniref:hypothetical protein n=1 Tax=Streptomyces violaceusniger TaxID=68280 RepID=UPI0036BAE959